MTCIDERVAISISRLRIKKVLVAIVMVLGAFSSNQSVYANGTEEIVSRPVAITEDEAEAIFDKLRQHPEVQSYANRAIAADYDAKGELGLPDPMLFVEQKDYRLRSDMGRGGGDKMIGFRQSIPRFGLRETRASLTSVEQRKNQLLQDYALASMKARVIVELTNLEKIEKLKEVIYDQKKLLAIQKESINRSIAANRAGVSMQSMTDAEINELDIELSELNEERHASVAMLMSLLGEVPDIILPVVEIVSWSGNPDITFPVAVAAIDVDEADKKVAMRKEDFGPNFEIQASGGRMNDGADGGSIMLGISVPLWASQNQRPKLQSAQSSLLAAKLERDSVGREMIEKLSHLQEQIDTSHKKLELLAHKKKLLEETSAAISREYESGKSDFLEVLKSRSNILLVQKETIKEGTNNTALIAGFNRYIMGDNNE